MVWHSHQAVVCWHCWLNRRPIRSRSGAQHKGGLFTVATFPKKTRPLNRLESEKTPERKNPPEGGFFGGFKDCVGCLWNLVWCRHQESNSGPTDYKRVNRSFPVISQVFILAIYTSSCGAFVAIGCFLTFHAVPLFFNGSGPCSGPEKQRGKGRHEHGEKRGEDGH